MLTLIAELHADLKEVESGMRGFVIAGDELFLAEVAPRRAELLEGLRKLRIETKTNGAQQRRVDLLGPLIARRLERADSIVVMRRTQGAGAAGQEVALGKGRELAQQIRGVVQEMEIEERSLLESRSVASEQSASRTRFSFGLIGVFASIIFLGLYFVYTRSSAMRERAERELHEFFSASLDLMGIAALDDGKFRRVSPSWEKTLGWTAAEITSRPWLDFVHPDDRASTVAEAEKLTQGIPVLTFENRYRSKDGTYRWLSWRVPAPRPGSNVAYSIARDITEVKRTEEEIRRLNADLARKVDQALAANKELEAFSYSVSHDLRAPLRAIDGFSRILIEDHVDRLDDEGKRLFSIVRSNAQQMGQLIDDLLQFSQLGRREVEKSGVDMAQLARNAVDEVRRIEAGRVVE
ncbi:MAG: sensor histidine kinase, partial [Vicinamibacteria bacterium]